MFRKTSMNSINERSVRKEISASAKVKIAIIGVLTLGFAVLPAAPSFAVAPTITGVTPASGSDAGGTAITITGTGFVTGASVRFGASLRACTFVTVVSATSITCITPSGTAGVVDLTVTNPAGGGADLLAGAFTYSAGVVAPTITSVTPTSGSTAGGTAITITGTGFVTGAGVQVGATLRACTSVTVVSATSITCITPSGTAGVGDLTVTNTDMGAGLLAGAFTYTTSADVAPVVVAVAPMTPEVAPVIKFTSAQVTCSLGKYSQTPASVVYTLVVGEDAVSTHFSNTMIPTWLVPWAGKTIDFGNATSVSATWDLQSAWKGKTVSCLTLAYANYATGSISSSAVVPS